MTGKGITRREFIAFVLAAGVAPGSIAAEAARTDGARGLPGLLDDIAEEILRASPETASRCGLDVGERAALKHRLDDRSLEATDAARQRVASQLRRLNAFDERSLVGMDIVHLKAMRATLTAQDALARHFAYGGATEAHPYVVSHLTGAYASVPDFLAAKHEIGDASDADACLHRMQMFAAVLGQEIERIRHDAAMGVTPPDFVQDRTLEQLKALRDQKAESSVLVATLEGKARAAGLGSEHAPAATRIWTDEIVPMIDAQIAAISALRDSASPDAGVWRLPDGDLYYAAALKIATTTDQDAESLHRMGKALVAEIGGELASLLDAQGYRGDSLAQRIGALLSDPQLAYEDSDSGRARLMADVAASLAEVERRLPRYFHAPPQTKVEIRRVPPFLESGAPFAYYEDPSIDGTRPGTFYLNLRSPAQSPRWMLTTTAFHEANPGHHLQQAVLQEGPPIPLIRKIVWSSAYGEGWAVYAEQLADEMGVYDEDPVGRIGYFVASLLRAARLVADTGIHALRWSRDEAIAWMTGNGIPRPIAVNEVERYCVWPGQACSYMVGKTEWVRLRERASAALGPRYDVRDFHAATLAVGAVPLTTLEEVVDGYIAAGLAD